MFLPRTSSSASLASLSSFRTTDSRSRPILPGSAIGWAPPTTAANSVNVSAQVHFSFLASQYRQHSVQHGLGIASGRYGHLAARANDDAKQRRGPSHVVAGDHVSQQSASRGPPRESGPHSGSRRGYAQGRLDEQRALEDVIAAASDPGRLKWEAKAALLNGSPAVALMLLAKAATLGSVSACISLAALYTTGVTRGGQLAVVLVHREPLSALAWLLEGCRLLRRRQERSRARGGGAFSSTTRKETLDQVLKIVALLERLLRTKEAVSFGPSSDGAELPQVVLPDLEALQTDLRRWTGLTRTDSKPSQAPAQLWPSILEVRIWLEAELDLLAPLGRPAAAPVRSPRGPDDEEDSTDLSRSPLEQGRCHLRIVRALAQSYALAQSGSVERKAIDATRLAWSFCEADSRSASGEAAAVCDAAKVFLEALESTVGTSAPTQLAGGQAAIQAGRDFWTRLDDSLPESAVPVVSRAEPKSSSMQRQKNSRPASPAPSPMIENNKRGDPPVQPSLQRKERRRSLEDLAPITVEAAASQQPALLRPTSPVRLRTTSIGLAPVKARSDAPRQAPTTSRRLLTRAISHSGGPPALTRASSQGISPSYSHHFGDRTITGGNALAVASKRPSSVVSDSPSLLFGGGVEGPPDVEVGNIDGDVSGPHAYANTSHVFPAAPRVDTVQSGVTNSRRRVVSMYGNASVNTERIGVTGSTASAYGHVGVGGEFDPTASLRENQYRRKRADSTASAATGTSLFSTQAIQDEKFISPPQGHVFGAVMPGEDALGTLRRQANAFGQLAEPQRRRVSSKAEQPANGEDKITPLLTERLERKLADSYAAQRPGLAALRGDSGMSIRSRLSAASKMSGWGPFRSPSVGVSSVRPPTLSMARAASNPATLTPSVSKADVVVTATDTISPNSATRAGASNALGSLRALSVRRTTDADAQSKTATHRPALKDAFIPPPTARAGPSSPRKSVRSFCLVDPSHNAYGSTSPVPGSPAAPSPTIPSALKSTASSSPTKRSPPGSVRSVRFDVPEGAGERVGGRLSPPRSRRSSLDDSGESVHSGLDAALAHAEDRSKLKTAAGCHNCGVKCINAPVDRKGRKFCSRDCRIEVKEQDKQAARGDAAGKAAPTDNATSPTPTAGPPAPSQPQRSAPTRPEAPPSPQVGDGTASIRSGRSVNSRSSAGRREGHSRCASPNARLTRSSASSPVPLAIAATGS
ncbi:unnamed protein product [Parajaminaea phylloscopi]